MYIEVVKYAELVGHVELGGSKGSRNMLKLMGLPITLVEEVKKEKGILKTEMNVKGYDERPDDRSLEEDACLPSSQGTPRTLKKTRRTPP